MSKIAKVTHINSTVTGNRSKAEQLIIDLLRFHFSRLEVIKNDRTLLGRQEIDIYLPLLRVAIECDGVTHFKAIFGEATLRRTQEADKRKNEKLKALNIKLIRITLPENSSKTVQTIKERIPSVVTEIKEWLEDQKLLIPKHSET